MNNNDMSQALVEQVKNLITHKQHAYIQGQGTRPNVIEPNSDTIISLKQHCGVIAYEPSELVIKVRAGALIKDIQQLLKDNQQQLGTDFPDYGNSTIGGAIATGETGSGRPFLGAIRDQVLGLGIINGQGQALNFGGQVMKNVAGYDVSRLLCGSYGELAVITDVTLKVVPLVDNITVDITIQESPLTFINQLAAQALPISAAVIDQGQIRLRLSGSNTVTSQSMNELNAVKSQVSDDYWSSIDNKTHEFFTTNSAVWQVRLAATQTLENYDAQSMIDWCGHQRYIKTNDDLNNTLKQKNISIMAFKNQTQAKHNAHLDDHTQRIQLALKAAFDAHRLFNR